MKKTRTYVAVLAMAASVSLLAACSNEDDNAPPADAGAPPATAPADPMTPAPGTQPDAGAPATPAPSSSMNDAKESASEAADNAGDAVASAAESARQAVADGAAKADAAIGQGWRFVQLSLSGALKCRRAAFSGPPVFYRRAAPRLGAPGKNAPTLGAAPWTKGCIARWREATAPGKNLPRLRVEFN